MNDEKYKDLRKYKKRFEYFINKHLKEDNESRVMFLNADYGWGKTTFLKKVMKVKENNFYSAWLNHNRDYLNEIYYVTNKINTSKKLIFAFGTIIFIWLCSIIGDPVVNFLLNRYNPSVRTICFIIFLAIIFIVLFCIFIYYYGLFYFGIFKKDYNEYLENKFLDKIIRRIDTVLIIEDVDRLSESELINIMKFSKKISDRILETEKYKKNLITKKYVLLTGDFTRVINLLNKQQTYSNSIYTEITPSNGSYIFEKVVGCKIEFLSILDRIIHLLDEHKIISLTKIEYDEIIYFVYKKNISVRFFNSFILDNLKRLIKPNVSAYHLLYQYYFKEKVVYKNEFNSENIITFPNCLNDWELLLQKPNINIDGIDYSLKTVFNQRNNNEYINIINKVLLDIYTKKGLYKYFILYKTQNKYPVFLNDILGDNKSVTIGGHLPIEFSKYFSDFLLSNHDSKFAGYWDMQAQSIPQRRCYFTSYDINDQIFNHNLEDCKVIDIFESNFSDTEIFIASYLGKFYASNKNEFETNYPGLTEFFSN